MAGTGRSTGSKSTKCSPDEIKTRPIVWNVCYWHKADNAAAPTFVRFWTIAAIGRSFGLEIDGLNHAPPFADVGSKHCLSRFLIEVERLKAIFGSSAGGSPHFVDDSSSEAGQSTPAGGHRTRDTDV